MVTVQLVTKPLLQAAAWGVPPARVVLLWREHGGAIPTAN